LIFYIPQLVARSNNDFLPAFTKLVLAMAKRSQPLSNARVYPLITAKERLAVWEKARGVWKRRTPEPLKELKKMRATWPKRNPSVR
jgi:hypothetical protein